MFFRKFYRAAKEYVRPVYYRPLKLSITKANWFNNTLSPVLFMIDDLTNAWYDHNGNGRMDRGEDWGAGIDRENSAFTFLKQNLLDRHPQIRTTMLTTLGAFQSFSKEIPFTYAAPIDATPEAAAFFRNMHFDARFELGYHGMHHGILDRENGRFIQEWDSFGSLEEATQTIEKARQLFESTIGVQPDGGKYCGYRQNQFSDDSIVRNSFFWWCRDWTPTDTSGSGKPPLDDMGFFGSDSSVVSVPANVHGYHWTRLQIRRLLARRLPISIQEHIAPFKTNGRIQTPNIVDDISELNTLFSYLESQNVWHATAMEAARYFEAREKSLIYDVYKDDFKVKYSGRSLHPILTVCIDATCICDATNPYLRITLPNGTVLAGQQYGNLAAPFVFNINLPLQNGTYQVEAVATPVETLTAKITGDQKVEYSAKGFTGSVMMTVPSEGCFVCLDKSGFRRMARRTGEDQVVFFCVDSSIDDIALSFPFQPSNV